ncbi:MAG: MFS transporter [Pseudomonadota bacterium]
MIPRLTPWRAVAAAFALNGVLLGIWASRIPAVMDRHALGEAELGRLLLIMGVGALLSFPLAGRMADRLGAVRLTRWIAGGYVVTVVLVGIAPNTAALGLALFMFGGAHGAMDVTMNSWATEVEKHLGRSIMSSFHAMWSLGTGLGAMTGAGASLVGLSLGTHFLVGALLAALLLGPALRLSWSSRRHAAGPVSPTFAIPSGALLLVGLVALASGLGEGAVADWSAVFLTDVVRTSEAQAALGFAVFSVAMVGARLCVDRVIMRFGPVSVARTGAIAAATGIALVAGIATAPAAFVGFVLMGLGYAALVPLAFSRAAADPVLPPGQAIAAVATLGYGAMLLGPPIIGFVAEETSLRVAFALLGGFALLAAFLAPALRPPDARV